MSVAGPTPLFADVIETHATLLRALHAHAASLAVIPTVAVPPAATTEALVAREAEGAAAGLGHRERPAARSSACPRGRAPCWAAPSR